MTQAEERQYLPNGFPDRLSVEEHSPFYCKVSLMRQPRILFNGVEQPGNTVEYCVSEGWIRRAARGMKKTRSGRKMAFKSFGNVEVVVKHG